MKILRNWKTEVIIKNLKNDGNKFTIDSIIFINNVNKINIYIEKNYIIDSNIFYMRKNYNHLVIISFKINELF